MLLDGNTAAIVDDLDAALRQNPDQNRVAESRERLIDRVVHHLIHEVVQPALPG
jgi:hypothetical protein